MNMMKKTTLGLMALAVAAGTAHAQQQGVSKSEILVGSILDLSGPIAAFGKQTRYGMQLRVDEINEQGGINGRKIKLLVEDDGYDPKKAVLAAQKLVNQDKVFVVAGHTGTAQNNASMPIQFEKNVINFLPVTSAREMYEPFHKLKFSFAAPYFDQMRAGIPELMKKKAYAKPCIIHQDDEFGLEVFRGAEVALKGMGKAFTERTTYKRGATDFSSQVARMKAAGCDLVVLGTIIRETIGTIGEARKTGFSPDFFGSAAAYTDPQAWRQGNGRAVCDAHQRAALHRHRQREGPLLVEQVQDPVQRRPDGVLGLRLRDHRRLCDRRPCGGSQPDHRVADQGDGNPSVPQRHARPAAAQVLAHQPARQ